MSARIWHACKVGTFQNLWPWFCIRVIFLFLFTIILVDQEFIVNWWFIHIIEFLVCLCVWSGTVERKLLLCRWHFFVGRSCWELRRHSAECIEIICFEKCAVHCATQGRDHWPAPPHHHTDDWPALGAHCGVCPASPLTATARQWISQAGYPLGRFSARSSCVPTVSRSTTRRCQVLHCDFKTIEDFVVPIVECSSTSCLWCCKWILWLREC